MRPDAYRGYLLTVLLVVLAFNYVDRLVLGLLLQDIKVDLSLSDTQLGLLTGIAFSLFYSVMGLPIARWADRGNRVTIITITTAVWSGAVMLCGLAGSFVQLLLIRIAVAAGEAGCVPPAYSFISHYFARAERPKAVAIYNLGGPLSAVIGYFLAGWLNELYGWRVTFMLMGLPGLALAALAWFTLKEPRCDKPAARPFSHTPDTRLAPEPSLKEVCRTLWANTTFCHLLIGFSLLSFFNVGIGQWMPAFFMRSYGLQSGEVGTGFAIIHGAGSLLGTLMAVVLASRYLFRNERRQLQLTAIGYGCFCLISAGIYLSSKPYMAFGLMGLVVVGTYVVSAPFLAILQSLVVERMRATSTAIFLMASSLIGLGLGPLAAGALSDALRPWAGDESLRYALLALCPGYLWGAWHYWCASRTVVRDLEAVMARPG